MLKFDNKKIREPFIYKVSDMFKAQYSIYKCRKPVTISASFRKSPVAIPEKTIYNRNNLFCIPYRNPYTNHNAASACVYANLSLFKAIPL